MNRLLHECPICGKVLEVTRLQCTHCETGIDGHFALGQFYHLAPEQLKFAEVFIRCEGKINRVGEELNISYPTVRTRLHDLIRAMGYEVRDDEAPATRPAVDRQAILTALSNGEITAEEAAKKLAGERA